MNFLCDYFKIVFKLKRKRFKEYLGIIIVLYNFKGGVGKMIMVVNIV